MFRIFSRSQVPKTTLAQPLAGINAPTPTTLITGQPGYGSTIISGPTTGKSSTLANVVGNMMRRSMANITATHLPENQRLMFLDWVASAYPQEIEAACALPTELLWEMYANTAPQGEDWDLMLRLSRAFQNRYKNIKKAKKLLKIFQAITENSEYFSETIPHDTPFAVETRKIHHAPDPNKYLLIFESTEIMLKEVYRQFLIIRDPAKRAAYKKAISKLRNVQ